MGVYFLSWVQLLALKARPKKKTNKNNILDYFSPNFPSLCFSPGDAKYAHTHTQMAFFLFEITWLVVEDYPEVLRLSSH